MVLEPLLNLSLSTYVQLSIVKLTQCFATKIISSESYAIAKPIILPMIKNKKNFACVNFFRESLILDRFEGE